MNVTVSRKETGSALILSLIAILIMAGIGGALFSLAVSEQRTTQNASRADAVYYVAEAGIDDAVNKLKAYAATASTEPPYELPEEFAKADFAVIGEILNKPDGSTYNEISGEFQSGSYVVTIEPAYAGLGDYKVRSIGTTKNGEKKGIETRLTAENAGGNSPFGLFGDVFMYAGGNVTTDGYNSSLGSYASQTSEVVIGGKTYTFANMTGSIGSNGNVQVGEPDGSSSVIVYGNATSGPTSTTTVHPGATVTGTTTPAKTPTPIPSTDYTVPAGAIKQNLSGGSGTYASGTYTLDSMVSKSGSVIDIKGDVVLYVAGDVDFHSKSKINIAEGGSLKIYQSSSTASLVMNAQAVINTSADPSKFTINSNVNTGRLNGGADFYGVIYAPNTNFTINGNSEIYGSATAKQVNITGTANFHYDENLGALPTTVITFDVKSYEQFIVHASDFN